MISVDNVLMPSKINRYAKRFVLILIIAVLDLLFIPVGTLIGVYELWVLLQEDTAKLFQAPGKA